MFKSCTIDDIVKCVFKLNLSISLLFVQNSAFAFEKTFPVADGMTLRLSTDFQRIKARVKGFGPVFCNGYFTFKRIKTSFIALPHTWSSWKTLEPAVSVSRARLNFKTVCDTGAIAQIKYHVDIEPIISGRWTGGCIWPGGSSPTPGTWDIYKENGKFYAHYFSVGTNHILGLLINDTTGDISHYLYGKYEGKIDSDLTRIYLYNSNLNVTCKYAKGSSSPF